MLHLFRKYQSYIYGVVAVVIIISFSFFGTYNRIPAESLHEQVAFTAIDGTPIKRIEVEEMATFIGTDAEDKRLFGGAWGPNFLNDGVIRNDLLSTGLGQMLAEAYPDIIARDLEGRSAKEKNFALYVHPEAPFISTAAVWAYLLPEMKVQFDFLQSTNNPLSADALDARIQLFLNERHLSAPLLQQVLRQQQKQYSWITPDRNLEYADLSLFGYHTFEDWFGPRYLRLLAEFLINSSKIAEREGYEVTKTEALADLMRNAEYSYQQNRSNPRLNVSSSSEYLSEQLKHLGMDQNRAVNIWRQVLLFRRLFHDVGNAALVDSLLHRQMQEYGNQTVVGTLYRLPAELRFADYPSLQKYELYLNAVAERDPANPLAVPQKFYPTAVVKEKSPELVSKAYVLEVAKVSKNALLPKVNLKEMWEWEVNDTNWEKLKKTFPELGIKPGSNRTERFAALDALEDSTRGRVDAMARQAVLEAHPEWIKQALAATTPQTLEVQPSEKNEKGFIKGLKDYRSLIQLLDKAPLREVSPELSYYSADNQNFYQIAVIERSAKEEVLSFADANLSGILDQLLEKRDSKDPLFTNIIKAIREDYAAVAGEPEERITEARAASLRFYAQARALKNALKQGKELPLGNWEKIPYRLQRHSEENDIDKGELFALKEGSWTPVRTPHNGDIYFFQLDKHEYAQDEVALSSKLNEAHRLLADGAQRHYMQSVLDQLRSKKAISLEYLSPPSEEEIE